MTGSAAPGAGWRMRRGRAAQRLASAAPWLAPALVACLAAWGGWYVYTRLVQPAGFFEWDEAAHALKGLLIADDLRRGDWVALLYDTYGQVYWPPLHSWLAAVAFLTAGPTLVTARLVSVAAFVLAVPVMYAAGRAMHPRFGLAAGLLATALFVTSPPIVDMAALTMLEVPGLLALCFSLWAYIWAQRPEARPRDHALFALGVLAAYFLKTNYAILLLAAWGLTELLGVRLRFWRLLNARTAWVLVPVAVVLAVWLAYPPKVGATWAAMVNIPTPGLTPYSLAWWLFVPRGLLRWPSTPLLSLVFAGALAAAVPLAREARVRFPLLMVAFLLVVSEFHHTKDLRHLLPALPPTYLLTGYVFEAWHLRAQTAAGGWHRWLPAGLAVLVAAHAALHLPPTLRPRTGRAGADVLAYTAEAARAGAPALILHTIDSHLLYGTMLEWHLAADAGVLPVTHASTALQLHEEQATARALEGLGAPEAVLRVLRTVLARPGEPGRTRALFVGHPLTAPYSRGPEAFAQYAAALFERETYARVIVITAIDSPLGDRYPLAYMEPALQAGGYRAVSTQVFEAASLRVDIYARRP